MEKHYSTYIGGLLGAMRDEVVHKEFETLLKTLFNHHQTKDSDKITQEDIAHVVAYAAAGADGTEKMQELSDIIAESVFKYLVRKNIIEDGNEK